MFQLLGLNTEHIPAALEALKEDSQQGIFGPRGDIVVITDETFSKVDRVLKEYGLPLKVDMPYTEYKRVVQLDNPTI